MMMNLSYLGVNLVEYFIGEGGISQFFVFSTTGLILDLRSEQRKNYLGEDREKC